MNKEYAQPLHLQRYDRMVLEGVGCRFRQDEFGRQVAVVEVGGTECEYDVALGHGQGNSLIPETHTAIQFAGHLHRLRLEGYAE